MKNRNNNLIGLYIIIVFLTTWSISCNTTKMPIKQVPSTNQINSLEEGVFGFEKDARVCFVGNSITHMGFFHNYVYQYHATRFPNNNISMYNCGISGDVTWGVIERMEEDILINNPTHAIIMLGMNDVQRHWYGPHPTMDTDTLRHREKALQDYKVNMEKIVNIFLDKGIKVIIERPSIYDQTAILPVDNNYGVNDALGICAEYGDKLAAKYNLKTVDYYGVMNRINTALQKSDSSFTLTAKEDRIHPWKMGHFVMSYAFLKDEKAPKYISEIIVDANNKNSKNCKNCVVSNIVKQGMNIKFSVKENSLPFSIEKDLEEALSIVPFMNDFNMEMLKVIALEADKSYQLKIDEEVIGSFTGEEFEKGINLAEYHNTPQYQQSEKVLKILQKLWELEANYRGNRFIEYLPIFKEMPIEDDLEKVKTYIDSAMIATGYTDPYYKSEFNKFLKNKPNENREKIESEKLRKKVYQVAIPQVHTFSIIVE